jgi:GAF domain-containing protein
VLDERPYVSFTILLNCLLELVDSQYGFIGEVCVSETTQKQFLKTHAISQVLSLIHSTFAHYHHKYDWKDNKEIQERVKGNYSSGLEFHSLDNLFGLVITSGKHVISNDPKNDPRAHGTPRGILCTFKSYLIYQGHFPLNSFLGIPICRSGVVIGMIGVSNKEGGYCEEDINSLQPFINTCANLIEAYRSNEKAEAELQNMLALMEKRV